MNRPEFSERAEIIREKGTNRQQFNKGQVDKYTWVDVGSSYLPSELVAAFLHEQLKQAEHINRKRGAIFESYQQALAPLASKGFIKTPVRCAERMCNGHIFHILTDSMEERTALIDYLKGRGISAVFHYVPLHTSPAGKKYGKYSGDLEITERVSDRLVRLPLYYDMNQEDFDYIIASIYAFYDFPIERSGWTINNRV